MSVVDVLLPYANVHRFNTFIIASVIRALMLWYASMKDDVRDQISKYLIKKVKFFRLFFQFIIYFFLLLLAFFVFKTLV